MNDANPETIYLKDYRPFGFFLDDVHLTFRLAPRATRVIARLSFRPNAAASDPEPARPFFLHGQDLKLIWAKIDGAEVAPRVSADGLTCEVPDAPFIWEAEVEISPATNTALEGLYMSPLQTGDADDEGAQTPTSRSMFCTQCEAEGFRKITFYPDRPDVMSVFTTRIEGDLPVLLSNGNLVRSGDGWAEWHDPWPKPAYLFALVAGDLVAHPGAFKTRSGKDVALNIYVRPGPDQLKCAFGMDALKRAMKWDEDVYQREYDLDVFNIVAVDDFNMGAMENKGLNIFNSSCVLASPQTSTDANFERIDAIIAHEYFHNWTGNRVTCRDWFQLCLKEGLTVFRDQQYTGDQGSHAVKRIEDAITLRARQFREDNGPLAHPVRPESFVEINNFYTITVYEKGAELIAMLKRLVGNASYYKAVALYFERFDGHAATIEDWLQVFEETTGRDLTQFKRWYSQAGTPRLTVTDDFKNGTYTLHFKQETPPTPGQGTKEPQVIPIAVGLLAHDGIEVLATTVLEMTKAEESFKFEGLSEKPVPSILRDFSAPVILKRPQSNSERAFLIAHDTDPFNKWDASDALATDLLMRMITQDAPADPAYLDAIATILADGTLDPAFRALAVALPSEDAIAQALHADGTTPDPLAIHHAVKNLRRAVAHATADLLPGLMAETDTPGPYSPDAQAAGKRSLQRTVLTLLSELDGGARAAKLFAEADNMTMQLAGLSALLRIGKGQDESRAFREQWRSDRLVMDKWFGLTVASAPPEIAADVASSLTNEPDFDMRNPNRFRAVFAALANHPAAFHEKSGAAYRLLGEWLIRLDAINPQTTARLSTAFESWRRYDRDRQSLMCGVLKDIAATPNLSRDTTEMVARMLGDAQ